MVYKSRKTKIIRSYPKQRFTQFHSHGYVNVVAPALVIQPDPSNPRRNVTKLGEALEAITIASNMPNINTYAPPVMKVKHASVTLHPSCNLNNFQSNFIRQSILYIVFVPQGQVLTFQVLEQHPEWILAKKPFTVSNQQTIPTTLTTYLTKNLNTGDTIQFAVYIQSAAQNPINMTGTYITNYCARSN